ncbi:hypothetical protein L917_17758 [Phytophthora nicotianae]|nr:hypothetical protein L915_18035 [Phytophthora nicotianae]ETL82017.1 hypothetical protein L917_17758 [Phytophthora nicotianae]ETM35228.1 hypothetical protein L914_17838 [Phytophthora nicotianae]
MEGHVDVVSVLLDAGANIDQRGPNGTTALLGACKNGHLGVVQVLVENGAATDVRDEEGMDCIATARAHGQEDVVDFLSSSKETPVS